MFEKSRKEPAAPDTNPVFVVGLFRSGTSLLYALLNQHPQIALMYECNVWDFPATFSGMRFRHDWRSRLEFYGRSLSRHRLIFGGSLRGLENVRKPEDLYHVFGETKNARLFGEKSPFYCTRLRQLAQKQPGCTFILIWRDPLEIHRSLKEAGRKSRFFRRRGMLNRLIFHQEQMIHQAAALSRSGSRIYHVTYADLVDHTEQSCRGICRFLGIEFSEKMLNLTGADLSAVFRAPQFEYLRRGKIERRLLSNNGADAKTIQKLERFRNRWNRLRHQLFNHQNDSPAGLEPSLDERIYHKLAGLYLHVTEGAKRVLFEFLPLPWLRTYRQAKEWFLAGQPVSSADQLSMLDQFLANKATILVSFAILAAVSVAHHFTGFAVTLIPFYMIPAATLALVVNQRWGTIAAVISTVVWAALQAADNPFVNLSHFGLLLWDAAMRFVVVEIFVLLLGRIRVEIRSKETTAD